MSDDEQKNCKPYLLRGRSTCPEGDEIFLAWKSRLIDTLWEEHLAETKEVDLISYVNKFRLRPCGCLLENLCCIWQLPWPVIKNMIDNKELTPRLDIFCWIDSDGNLYHRPHDVIVYFEDIVSIEEKHKELKDNHISYDKSENERKEFERRVKDKQEMRQAKLKIDSLECQNKQLNEDNESLEATIKQLKTRCEERSVAPRNCISCPSNQKLEERLEIFKIGIRMALRCAADGSPQSKAAHEALWRDLHGVKTGRPNSRYFDAFRAALDEFPNFKCPDPRQK